MKHLDLVCVVASLIVAPPLFSAADGRRFEASRDQRLKRAAGEGDDDIRKLAGWNGGAFNYHTERKPTHKFGDATDHDLSPRSEPIGIRDPAKDRLNAPVLIDNDEEVRLRRRRRRSRTCPSLLKRHADERGAIRDEDFEPPRADLENERRPFENAKKSKNAKKAQKRKKTRRQERAEKAPNPNISQQSAERNAKQESDPEQQHQRRRRGFIPFGLDALIPGFGGGQGSGAAFSFVQQSSTTHQSSAAQPAAIPGAKTDFLNDIPFFGGFNFPFLVVNSSNAAMCDAKAK